MGEQLEDRVFRLETQMNSVQHDLGEAKDRLKNAHHRIDETNTSIKELREEMRHGLNELSTKVENLGLNLAQKDKADRRWRKALIIIGALAITAFIGMFIQDTEVRKVIGEIAVKVGAGVASSI